MTTTSMVAIIALIAALVAVIAASVYLSTRRTRRLREKFGGAEYDRSLKDAGSRRRTESGLDQRSARVGRFNVQPLSPADRTRFEESWRRLQPRFVDGPIGAVAEADQLMRDVMSARGYPVTEFEQRVDDISVDHPLVVEHYRTAHEIALRQQKGEATTEDLRQAMIHYRTLFEDLVGLPEPQHAAAAS